MTMNGVTQNVLQCVKVPASVDSVVFMWRGERGSKAREVAGQPLIVPTDRPQLDTGWKPLSIIIWSVILTVCDSSLKFIDARPAMTSSSGV